MGKDVPGEPGYHTAVVTEQLVDLPGITTMIHG
jgi:hypothetical protein